MTDKPAAPPSIGEQELNKAYHPDDVAAFKQLQSFCPDYFHIIQEFGLGSLWQRPCLSAREKELVAIAALVTQGDSEREIRQHLHTAPLRGLTITDITECIILLSIYIGVPRTYNAMEIIRHHG